MNPLSPTSSRVVERYLRRLRRALRPLPDRDRAAIVSEIENHIAERTREPKIGAAEVLAGLGDSAALARGYREAYRLTRVLSRAAPSPLPVAMLSRAARGLILFLAGPAAVLLYTFGLSFVAIAVLKPIAPRSVGLWITPGNFAFGALSSPGPAATEVLGLWIVPVSLTAAVLSYLTASALSKLFGRCRPRRSNAIFLA